MIEYSLEDRGKMIIEECLKTSLADPVKIFISIANNDFIRMHGPEHHLLDGACILTAYYNAGGKLELRDDLERLINEGLRMPGATCGLWGVCGSVTSIGAALAIIDGTGPLTSDDTWGKHMEFTSCALKEMSAVGGPRCCKRDAFISFTEAIKFINEHYDVDLPVSEIVCEFSERNEQCIKGRCPFSKG